MKNKESIFHSELLNKKYGEDVLRILEKIVNSEGKALEIDEFKDSEGAIGNSYEVLKKLADSQLITIQEREFVDYEDNGQAYGGNAPNIVFIKNKAKVKSTLSDTKKIVKDISAYHDNAKSFLSKSNRLAWRCVDCGRLLGSYTSAVELIEWLGKFLKGEYRACKKCRKRNIFSISPDGSIKFSGIEKLST